MFKAKLRVAESVPCLDILHAKKPGPNKVKTPEGVLHRMTFCSHVWAGINSLSLSNGSCRSYAHCVKKSHCTVGKLIFLSIPLLSVITKVLSKIIERIIHNQTQEFLNKNNILYKYQSGFRKHHSTDTCLSYLTDKVKIGFEEGLLTGMVLIDLQKAFDTIDHSILLKKMRCLGFAGKTIAWYTSYLTDRSFIVNVGKESSSPGKLSCGVPQGSILGPLLFLLYVNDMPQEVNSELLLYADDTCLIYMGKDIQKIEEQLNSDFTSLCEWFIDNKLSVHFGEEKTKSILFGTKRQLKDQRDLNLKYGDIEIKQHSRVTYLGCILDNILSGEHMAAKVLNTTDSNFSTVNKNFYHFLYDAYYATP